EVVARCGALVLCAVFAAADSVPVRAAGPSTFILHEHPMSGGPDEAQVSTTVLELKGAKCRTTRNAERRRMPNSAECRTTPDAEGRRISASRAFRPLAHFGISRTSASRALRHLAHFGISRTSASRALRHLAHFGISRISAFSAVPLSHMINV